MHGLRDNMSLYNPLACDAALLSNHAVDDIVNEFVPATVRPVSPLVDGYPLEKLYLSLAVDVKHV